MIDLNEPLDLDNPEADAFLSGIQGNILIPHAREHVLVLALVFTAESDAVRAWLGQTSARITWAADQRRQTLAFKANGDGGTFASLALSSAGYAAIGISAAPNDPDFQAGMKNNLRGDPPPASWDEGLQQDVHALLILADQDDARLDAAEEVLAAGMARVARVAHRERGKAIKRDRGDGKRQDRVHFDFADGISQPLAIKQEIEKSASAGERRHWDPAAPLGLLVTEDPVGGFGSYLVYRKLEQDVAGFLRAEQELADAMGLQGDRRQIAEALIVGRYRDGRAAIETPDSADGERGNDFNFDADRFGNLCPLHSHIRKTNPRGDLRSPGGGRPSLSLEAERGFRIGRRGIPYGSDAYFDDGSPPPSKGVGLLFMCVASRLLNFKIQQDGSDANDFPTFGVGVDAAIGHSAAAEPQLWAPPPDGVQGERVARFAFANLVTLKGGEYFFLPSRAFFESLS
jgi:deferrochelatase/peroxidase EfeB